MVSQHLCELSHFVPSVAEDQHSVEILPMNNIEKQRKFVTDSHDVNDLFDGIDCDLFRFYLHGNRVTGPLRGEAGDFLRQRCTEEKRLTLVSGRGAVDDPTDIGDETHVQHPIRLINNEHFGLPQIDVATAFEVE